MKLKQTKEPVTWLAGATQAPEPLRSLTWCYAYYGRSHSLFSFAFILMSGGLVGCSQEPLEQNWVGTYQTIDYERPVPIYLTTITYYDGKVAGLARQGLLQTWIIKGLDSNGKVDLHLEATLPHEVQMQYMHLIGNRDAKAMTGRWSDGSERSGQWNVSSTNLEFTEAMPKTEIICEDEVAKSPDVVRITCS